MEWTSGTNLRQLLTFELLLLLIPGVVLGGRLYDGPTLATTEFNLNALLIFYMMTSLAVLIRIVALAPLRVGIDSEGLTFVTLLSVKRVKWSEVGLPPRWHVHSGWGVECRRTNGDLIGYFGLTRSQAKAIASHHSSPEQRIPHDVSMRLGL